jgi:hypothetical protein
MSPLAPPRLFRTTVIVALLLLTSAATAYAECAWILWAGGVKPSGEAVYAPIEGYPTRADCVKGRSASSIDEVEQLTGSTIPRRETGRRV